jgi:hypothetical protein
MTNAHARLGSTDGIRTVGTLPVTSFNAGVTLEIIRRRLGHANAQTVLRYADQRDTTTDAEIRTWRRHRTTRRPNS